MISDTESDTSESRSAIPSEESTAVAGKSNYEGLDVCGDDFIPVKCRGMKLLGFALDGTIHVFVHQLSLELWKLYDTPRVSVQKKLLDLDIEVTNCTKVQIQALRKAGIENFRATTVPAKDAERLCDALEHSRKERGLEKHAVKSRDRQERKEEVRAKRLTFQMNSILLSDRLHRQMSNRPLEYRESSVPEAQEALNGETAPKSGGKVNDGFQGEAVAYPSHIHHSLPPVSIAELLVAEEAALPEEFKRSCALTVEVVPNDAYIGPPPLIKISSTSTPRMDHSLGSAETVASPGKLASENAISDKPEGDNCATSNTDVPRSSQSSAVVGTSEQEDQFFVKSSSWSANVGGRVRSPSTPDRFLILESDSELDCDAAFVTSDQISCSETASHAQVSTNLPELIAEVSFLSRSSSVKGAEGTIQAGSSSILALPKSITSHAHGLKIQKVTSTKLRHFAKTTSPSVHVSQFFLPETPESLIVSIPHSLLSPSSPKTPLSAATMSTKPRKPTALFNFATKKRAITPSPSELSDVDTAAPIEVPDFQDVGRRTKMSNLKGGGWGLPRLIPIQSSEPLTGCKLMNEMASSSNISKRSEAHDPVVLATSSRKGAEQILEVDQLSIASVNTITSSFNTTTNECMEKSGEKSQQSKLNQAKDNFNRPNTNTSFSLEALFSFCSPTLTVRDGELVPQQSLSVKNIDQSDLPPNHPLENWSLGQPVCGPPVMKSKKLKKLFS